MGTKYVCTLRWQQLKYKLVFLIGIRKVLLFGWCFNFNMWKSRANKLMWTASERRAKTVERQRQRAIERRRALLILPLQCQCKNQISTKKFDGEECVSVWRKKRVHDKKERERERQRKKRAQKITTRQHWVIVAVAVAVIAVRMKATMLKIA